MKSVLIGLGLGLGLELALGLAAPGHAQAREDTRYCAARAQIVAGLLAQFGERVRASYVGPDGAEYLLLASAVSGNWTVIRSAEGGLACLFASGEGLLGLGPRV